jgi:hypothetical protein
MPRGLVVPKEELDEKRVEYEREKKERRRRGFPSGLRPFLFPLFTELPRA